VIYFKGWLMKLGILSDTHNNDTDLQRALAIFRQQGVERLIFCGDVTSPDMIAHFKGWAVHFVYGNVDEDRASLAHEVKHRLADSTIGMSWSGEIKGVRLAATHGHEEMLLEDLIQGGLYDFVFRGHSHTRLDSVEGSTRVINPGALGGKRTETCSVCIVELPSGEATFVEVPD
jgi:hypothetical protein